MLIDTVKLNNTIKTSLWSIKFKKQVKYIYSVINLNSSSLIKEPPLKIENDENVHLKRNIIGK